MSEQLRVLCQGRPDLFEMWGGDATLLVKTAEAVRAFGVQVDVSLDAAPDLRGYDLVHLFSSTADASVYHRGMNALRRGVPLAVSTIYWSIDEILGVRSRYGRAKLLHRLLGQKATGRLRAALWRWMPGWRRMRHLFAQASVLLPNSREEEELVRRDLGLGADPPALAVFVGVDGQRFLGAGPEAFVSRYGWKDFVLCVARLEVRKNQLILLQAAQQAGFPVVLVGVPNPKEPEYVALCQRHLERARGLWIQRLPLDMLISAYAAANVHVLPSWYETPGLASLEAGVAGCQVVCADRGSVREYLGDLAFYCQPDDVDSVCRAVEQAMAAPSSHALQEHILAHFTWEAAARQTLEGYRLALGARAPG